MIAMQIASALCVASIAHATWVCWRRIDWSEDPEADREWELKPTEITWQGTFPRRL